MCLALHFEQINVLTKPYNIFNRYTLPDVICIKSNEMVFVCVEHIYWNICTAVNNEQVKVIPRNNHLGL